MNMPYEILGLIEVGPGAVAMLELFLTAYLCFWSR